jgi:hypothetical protein
MNLGRSHIAGTRSNSACGLNIVFATFSKPFPTLSGTIQSVLVFYIMDHACQLAAFPSSISIFGYGAHILISAPIPMKKIISPHCDISSKRSGTNVLKAVRSRE